MIVLGCSGTLPRLSSGSIMLKIMRSATSETHRAQISNPIFSFHMNWLSLTECLQSDELTGAGCKQRCAKMAKASRHCVARAQGPLLVVLFPFFPHVGDY